MGDMKTPDFDDLLAAFDIPDATGLGAKESIQEHPGEPEGHLKHTGLGLDGSALSHQAASIADIPVVSVIVKNTSRQECLEEAVDRLQPVSLLHNGLRGMEVSTNPAQLTNSGFPKPSVNTLNGSGSGRLVGKAPLQHKPEGTAAFSQAYSQFSPISSPESEDAQCGQVDSCPEHEGPYFPEATPFMEPSISDHQNKMSPSMFDKSPKSFSSQLSFIKSKAHDTMTEEQSESYIREKEQNMPLLTGKNGNNGTFPTPKDHRESRICAAANPHVPILHPNVNIQTSKLSSCLQALVALNAKTDLHEQTNARETSSAPPDCMKSSPKVPISPRSPRSPLETVRRLMKPSESPASICSDSSGMASPVMPTGSPPAIPRVRIKTIKTVSGQIKRTVTSVLPDSETDEIPSACESSPAQSIISEDSNCNMSPSQSQSAANEISAVVSNKGTSVSPHLSKASHKSGGHLKRSGLMQCPVIFQKTVEKSMAQQRQKQKRNTSLKTGHAISTNVLPKAMHLARLNLVPHSAASVKVWSSSQKQGVQASPVAHSSAPLVHQVQTAIPPTHSTIPNTAAGTLHRLLNSMNPVPTYVPNLNPPPESNITLPPRGFRCLECGDSFGVERSLAYHYSRRSVHIEVACTHCAKTLVFFNKCALLAHAREHRNSKTVMQCTQLFMKPLAEDQMFVPPSAELAVNVESCASTSPVPISQPVMPQYPDNVIHHQLHCLECSKWVPDCQALANHYQRNSEDTQGLICKVCAMLLPNKCSFRAHQRIHAHKSPYCCPECGALCRSADIQKHVKENCLHYTRKPGFKCLHCDAVFKSIHGQRKHIEEKHCEVFYRCSLCAVAFKSPDATHSHSKNKHNTEKSSPQLIFKCSCEMVFKKKQRLVQHFQQNASKRATCIFKCPECSVVFPQKQQLMLHFKSVHDGIYRVEAEQNGLRTHDGAPRHAASPIHQPQTSGLSRHRDPSRRTLRPQSKPSSWACRECYQAFTDRDIYVSHVKNYHGKKSLKRFPCRQCEQSFNSSPSLRRHIHKDHDAKKKIYTCWYCTDRKTIFTSSAMLRNHTCLMHGVKLPDGGLLRTASVHGSTQTTGERQPWKRAAGGLQEGWGASEHQDRPPPKQQRAQLRCSKCGFTAEDEAHFQQHIPQHKSHPSVPQCLRCGLCFTSALSLYRHLFIVHKVRDPEEEEGGQEMKGTLVREEAQS